jgi:hypothetical protein
METSFRVWWIPQIPMSAFRYNVPDIYTGRLLCDALAEYDQFQYENNVKPDYSNAGGIEFLDEDGDWVSIDPEDEFDLEWIEAVQKKRGI